MAVRSRPWMTALTIGFLVLVASTTQAAMSLEFAITPMVQPHSGSLDRDSSGRIVATNLAVSSVTSVETAKVVPLAKYLDLQTAGTTGSNFFILDGLVQQYGGSAPTSMTSPATSSSLVATGSGYLFTMDIKNGYVSDDLAAKFGISGGYGWTGVLTLDIAAFNPSLGSSQVTSGMLTLTSPAVAAAPILPASAAAAITAPTPAVTATQVLPPVMAPIIAPVPAGLIVNPAAVPEPSSILLAGLGLIIVVGRTTSVARRTRL